MSTSESAINLRLWKVCAGNTAHIPLSSSKIYYFPQGHAEQSFGVRFPDPHPCPQYLCEVLALEYLADPRTDEVYIKYKLLPLEPTTVVGQDNPFIDVISMDGLACMVKQLTPTDANNGSGGGLTIPPQSADVFLPLFNRADGTFVATDVHGKTWTFRYIYGKKNNVHKISAGWATFVDTKKLVAGDSIIFLRIEEEKYFVGIRKGGSFPRVSAESVIEAASKASTGAEFDVCYFPAANRRAFCVSASVVMAANQIGLSRGVLVKMPIRCEFSLTPRYSRGSVSIVGGSVLQWRGSWWDSIIVDWADYSPYNPTKVCPWHLVLDPSRIGFPTPSKPTPARD